MTILDSAIMALGIDRDAAIRDRDEYRAKVIALNIKLDRLQERYDRLRRRRR